MIYIIQVVAACTRAMEFKFIYIRSFYIKAKFIHIRCSRIKQI